MIELINLIFKDAPKNILIKIEDVDIKIKKWINFKSNWSLDNELDVTIKNFIRDIEGVQNILDILGSENTKELIVIPDTNSLIISADPLKYKEAIKSDKFTFLILPTVLGELDHLKIMHKNENVMKKAKKVIKRIRGWRKQGSLLIGVTFNHTITIKMIAKDPDMNSTLSWLDKDNADDRIIASVLEAQRNNPCSRVILATGDINLQNKAEAAMIEYLETEDIYK